MGADKFKATKGAGRFETMRVREDVTSNKLRGGFYTPEELVRYCWTRIEKLTQGSGERSLRIIEPSAGSGNFFKYLAGHAIETKVAHVQAVELVKEESIKCKAELSKFDFSSTVQNTSIFSELLKQEGTFDAAVGNPPYVRYQFIADSDLTGIEKLSKKLDIKLSGVSNLWIPVILAALGNLKTGGAFAFVVPTELLTGISAGVFREWVIENVSNLQLDFYPPNSFPGVLQEILIFSGIKTPSRTSSSVSIVDNETGKKWRHRLEKGHQTWTHLYLPPAVWEYIQQARSLAFFPLLDIAKLSVATVTGANQFFCINDSTLEEYQLHPWVKPLLPRSRFVEGIIAGKFVESRLKAEDAPRWLLDVAKSRELVSSHEGLSRYLQLGVSLDLHNRYKTRIRNDWFEVPVIKPGQILMSKRSHYFPRLIFNDFGFHTTDTIYSGFTHDKKASSAKSFVASFHNSLTLLTAELEGRSFGGGVLELVPSEIGRLLVPKIDVSREEFNQMNLVAQVNGDAGDELIRHTNRLIESKLKGLPKEYFQNIEEARILLQSRRLRRSSL